MLRPSEYILWLTGLVLLATGASGIARFAWFEQNQEMLSSPDEAGMLPAVRASSQSIGLQITGRLEVPRVRLSVLVVDGDETAGLAVAAVHLADTPSIGALGNSVIAGHRDAALWPLRQIKVGDHVRFHAAHGTLSFLVQSIRIVRPEDTSVLAGHNDRSTLTLVTCYPFRFVGSAPMRFVVEARRVS